MKVVSSLICALIFSFTAHAGFLPLANIIKIHGKVLINNMKVEEGSEIVQGMVIKIPKKGDYVIIKYQNGHKVRFTEATVKIEELTEKISLLSLLQGQLHTIVKKLTPNEVFIVKTKYASFAVRGTQFGITVDKKKRKSYLCVCEGVVAVTQGALKSEVHKNEDLWIGANAKELIVQQSTPTMFNMTESIIKELEAL
jgi:hypothetical protein